MAGASKSKHRITPLEDRVVILPSDETESMRGGLYIPDTAKEKPIQGEVIAVGPGRRKRGSGADGAQGRRPGGLREVQRHPGRSTAEEIILIKESDVIAKLR